MCGTCGCGESEQRMFEIEQDVMSSNHEYACINRAFFSDNHILTINLLSSPGSGKTTLLEKTLNRLMPQLNLAVIEGDQQSDQDARRIAATKTPVIQINTGKGCHLDAHRISHAVKDLALQPNSVLFIENVGNLVCPALFDLGESFKVVILSVTEGDDKPLKYPDMFATADLMIINKLDLLPHVDFSIDACIAYAKRLNPNIEILQLSATTGEGLDPWLQWLSIQAQLHFKISDNNPCTSHKEINNAYA